MRYVLLLSISVIIACNSNNNKITLPSVEQDDTLYLFVGSYTQDLGFVDGKGAGISVFSCDKKTGKLEIVTAVKSEENPAYLSYDKINKILYAANENEKGSITSFTFSSEKQQLSKINTVSTLGGSPCHISLDRNQEKLYSANYVSGSVSAHTISKNGTVSAPFDTISHKGKGSFAMRQDASHMHMISSSPYDHYMHGIDLGTDKIYHYEISDNKIKLDKYTTGILGAGARHMVFHPSNGKVYIGYEFTNQIQVLDATVMPFQEQQIVSALTEAYKKHAITSSAIKLHPNGEFLYLANRKGDADTKNSISVFAVDGISGKLMLRENMLIDEAIPRDFSIDPTGSFLYVAGQNSDNIVQYKIDKSDGTLARTDIEVKVKTPSVLVFSS